MDHRPRPCRTRWLTIVISTTRWVIGPTARSAAVAPEGRIHRAPWRRWHSGGVARHQSHDADLVRDSLSKPDRLQAVASEQGARNPRCGSAWCRSTRVTLDRQAAEHFGASDTSQPGSAPRVPACQGLACAATVTAGRCRCGRGCRALRGPGALLSPIRESFGPGAGVRPLCVAGFGIPIQP